MMKKDELSRGIVKLENALFEHETSKNKQISQILQKNLNTIELRKFLKLQHEAQNLEGELVN